MAHIDSIDIYVYGRDSIDIYTVETRVGQHYDIIVYRDIKVSR